MSEIPGDGPDRIDRQDPGCDCGECPPEPHVVHLRALLRSCCPSSAPPELRSRIVTEIHYVAISWSRSGAAPSSDEGTSGPDPSRN